MLSDVPEAGNERTTDGARVLAVAGTGSRRMRTLLTFVAVKDVRPNRDQPRKHFAPDKLEGLAASIRERGLLQPVVVRQSEHGFELLAGERRLRAAELAGIERLPALVREGDDALEIALIENLQREDLSPLEEAEALGALIERRGYTHQEVATLLGKSRPYVSNTLALMRLPPEVKADLQGDSDPVPRELLMGIARAPDDEAAVELWRQVRQGPPSVRQFRAGKGTTPRLRTPGRQALLAARRLNRTLRVLLAGAELPDLETASLSRMLRRTQRLVQRQLDVLARVPA